MSSRKPWEPKIERDSEFNPFAKVDAAKGSFTESRGLLDLEEDTSPLQGTKDLSDVDSLQDVIADAYAGQESKTETKPEAKPST